MLQNKPDNRPSPCQSKAVVGQCAKATIFVFALSLLLSLSAPFCLAENHATAADDQRIEYKVKAAYLYNFIKFVNWPTEIIPNDDKSMPIQVCILGDDPFGEILDPIMQRSAKGHPISIKRYDSFNEINQRCHVLFISKSEEKNLEGILSKTGQTSILTVSDVENFAKQGGVIGFTIKDGKVRLEINRKVSQECGLKISSKLLELATIIE